ncbi:MAG TPA: phenylalanine--tRNA ligase subunit alpha [bacterium]|nr:phenylalanine--tRNA ligase subunit alpha [bacterium]
MIDRLQALLQEAQTAIPQAPDLKAVEEFRIKYLGKSGQVTEILKGLGQVPADQKPQIGKVSNEVKNRIAELIEGKKEQLESKQTRLPEGWDPTLPGRSLEAGKGHPLMRVQQEICDIFKSFGFDQVEGTDFESDYYNFKGLNFPEDHPARDSHDTFYLGPDLLLRTHTTTLQVHVMEDFKPPFKVVAPGRVYRNEAVDATHHHIFHQVDGFLVAEGIHFGHLKGVLDNWVKKFFGSKIETRFRPSFFPFTEPSAEVDISCVFCQGKGCRICKQSGWVEIMGCGMIHPNVLENCKVDPERWTGFAFGMGVERVAMFKYDVDDIRLFYQNDIRFLKQF